MSARIAAAGAWISFFVYFVMPPLLFALSSPHSEGPRTVFLWIGGAYFLTAGLVLHLLVSGYAALWTHVFLLWLLARVNAPTARDDRQL
jgi:hypothetical protein